MPARFFTSMPIGVAQSSPTAELPQTSVVVSFCGSKPNASLPSRSLPTARNAKLQNRAFHCSRASPRVTYNRSWQNSSTQPVGLVEIITRSGNHNQNRLHDSRSNYFEGGGERGDRIRHSQTSSLPKGTEINPHLQLLIALTLFELNLEYWLAHRAPPPAVWKLHHSLWRVIRGLVWSGNYSRLAKNKIRERE